jgi:hypothetical protein
MTAAIAGRLIMAVAVALGFAFIVRLGSRIDASRAYNRWGNGER